MTGWVGEEMPLLGATATQIPMYVGWQHRNPYPSGGCCGEVDFLLLLLLISPLLELLSGDYWGG